MLIMMDELLSVMRHLSDAFRCLRAPTSPTTVFHPSFSPSVCVFYLLARCLLLLGARNQVFGLGSSLPFTVFTSVMLCFLRRGSTCCCHSFFFPRVPHLFLLMSFSMAPFELLALSSFFSFSLLRLPPPLRWNTFPQSPLPLPYFSPFFLPSR